MTTLLAIAGFHRGIRYRITDDTSIGRASSCTIQLLDEKVSRVHSRVSKTQDGYVLSDAGSSNGTCLNGRVISGPQKLTPGDHVGVGGNLLIFDSDLQILPDLQTTGTVVIAPDPAAQQAVESPGAQAPPPPNVTPLLGQLATSLADVDELGAAGARLRAAVTALGAERAALLRAPRPGEPLKAIQTWPKDADLTVSRTLLQRALNDRSRIHLSSAILNLDIGDGISSIRAFPGSAMSVPIASGDRLLGVLYLDSRQPEALPALGHHAVLAALVLGFGPLLQRARASSAARRSQQPSGEQPVARSSAMQAVLKHAESLAAETGPILVTGEPGTGKAFLGRQIHEMSSRSDGPFVAVHCASLPPRAAESLLFGHEQGAFSGAREPNVGFFEQATGGSLLLDEIDSLPPKVQTRVLRTLQEARVYRLGATRPIRVDVRLMAGTHDSFETLLKAQSLVPDLLEHLRGLRVTLPPLRERRADVEALSRRFVARFNARTGSRRTGFSPEAVQLLEAHPWPRNVRDLQDVVNRLLVRAEGEKVQADEVKEELTVLPGSPPRTRQGKDPSVQDIERQRVSRALARSDGNKAQAALLLGTTRPIIDRLIAQYDIEPTTRPVSAPDDET